MGRLRLAVVLLACGVALAAAAGHSVKQINPGLPDEAHHGLRWRRSMLGFPFPFGKGKGASMGKGATTAASTTTLVPQESTEYVQVRAWRCSAARLRCDGVSNPMRPSVLHASRGRVLGMQPHAAAAAAFQGSVPDCALLHVQACCKPLQQVYKLFMGASQT